jgi:hypothetical protein
VSLVRAQPPQPSKPMSNYDFEHLRREFLENLKVPQSPIWINATQIIPTPFEPVLICGPVWKHEVAYLEPGSGKWVIGDRVADVASYPFWMPLPPPPRDF